MEKNTTKKNDRGQEIIISTTWEKPDIPCPSAAHRDRNVKSVVAILHNELGHILCQCSCGCMFRYKKVYQMFENQYEILEGGELDSEYDQSELREQAKRTRIISIIQAFSQGKHLTISDGRSIGMSPDMTIGFLLTNQTTGETTVSKVCELTLSELYSLLERENIIGFNT